MKKILIIIPLLTSIVFAQNVQTKKSDVKSKPELLNQSVNSLDGKAYKITFTLAADEDKKIENKSHQKDYEKKTINEVENIGSDKNQPSNEPTSENAPLVHKHAVLRFENGAIQSSVLNKQNMSACAYRVTATGSNQLCSFTSGCTMNASTPAIVPPVNENPQNKISGKSNLPEGSDEVDRAPTDVKNNSIVNVIPDTTLNLQSSVNGNLKNSSMAYISGLVDGDTITGTLTCWTDDGKQVKYNFTGTKASKNDVNSELETGMK